LNIRQVRKLADRIAQFALEKKAKDIVILDLRKITGMADYFILATGDSDTHVKAIADHIEDEAWKIGNKVWHKEGYQYRQWILLDFVDVVGHIFQKDSRTFYALERLWGDAKRIEVFDNPEKSGPKKIKKYKKKISPYPGRKR
jgi:ribosome-associated protein